MVNISQLHDKNHLGKSDGVVAVCQFGVAGNDVAGLPHLVVGIPEDTSESLLQLRAVFNDSNSQGCLGDYVPSN